MINIYVGNNKAEKLFLEMLQSKLERLSEIFKIKTEISTNGNLRNIDVWLKVTEEDLKTATNKEELLDILKTKQRYALELKKRAINAEDRFEYYEVAVNLLVHFLENKPFESTMTIPTIEVIKSYIECSSISLRNEDIEALQTLLEHVQNLTSNPTLNTKQEEVDL